MAGAVGILLPTAMGARHGCFVVTGRPVLFVQGSWWNQRPKGLLWADPLAGAAVSEAVTDAGVWNRFLYHRPGEDEPVRMNVGRVREDRLQAILAALPGR